MIIIYNNVVLNILIIATLIGSAFWLNHARNKIYEIKYIHPNSGNLKTQQVSLAFSVTFLLASIISLLLVTYLNYQDILKLKLKLKLR